MNDGPDHDRRGGPARTVLIVAGVFVVVLLLVVAFVLGRGGDDGGGSGQPGAAPPLGGGDSVLSQAPITWSSVGSAPVPVSPVHGPAEQTNGLAAGFSHDELGAVIAAINISSRLSGQAGPVVYETTARQQCVGDIEATISSIQDRISTSVPGEAVPIEFFYRIGGGDPRGDLVAVDIAARSIQSTELGGFALITETLQWIDGDWRLQVPPSPPRLIESVEGFRELGGPNAS